MTHRRTLLGVTLLLLALASAFPAHAAWRVLGIIKADKGLDRDEVTVSGNRTYRQIKLKADAADVEIESLHVVYGSGEPDRIDVRRTIRARPEGGRPFHPKGRPLVQDDARRVEEGDRHNLRERLIRARGSSCASCGSRRPRGGGLRLTLRTEDVDTGHASSPYSPPTDA
jgi:hypothetical protein